MNPDYIPPCSGNPAPFDAALDRTAGPAYHAAVKECKALCGTCDPGYKAACLAANRDEPGVIAGLTRAERRPKTAATVRAGCGTPHGDSAHYRAGERVCRACADSHAAYVRECVKAAARIQVIRAGRTRLTDQIEAAKGEWWQAVVKLCAEAFDVDPAMVTDTTRVRDAASARQVACWVARREGLSFPAIGLLVNRDHSTARHGILRIESEPELRAVALGIWDRISQESAA